MIKETEVKRVILRYRENNKCTTPKGKKMKEEKSRNAFI